MQNLYHIYPKYMINVNKMCQTMYIHVSYVAQL
jgi:hypothetical protein